MPKKIRVPHKFKYQALQYVQRDKSGLTFVVFHAPAGDIKLWADIDRLEDNPKGAQRALRAVKVSKISGFFQKNPKNTIPTAIVIALDAKAASFVGSQDGPNAIGKHGLLTLEVKGQNKPGLIIDGQHRAYGTAGYSGDTHLNVVAFLGGDDAERAFQFVIINNTATKVSKDHIKALNLQFDREKLNTRLIESAGVSLGMSDRQYDDLELIDRTGPFKGLLELPTNKHGFIPPAAVESALLETRNRAALLGIQEFEREVFLRIWYKIHEVRKAVWLPYPKSKLLLKSSIHAMTKWVLESLIGKLRNEDTPVDFTAPEELDPVVDRVVSRIPEQFWTAEWTATELDTSSGRDKLYADMQLIDSNVRFSRPWYDKVSLIDPALLMAKASSTLFMGKAAGKRKKKKAST